MASPSDELNDEVLLTAHEVARLLKVSRRTVWRWAASGRLPTPIRQRRNWIRWPLRVIRSFVAELERKAHEPSGQEPRTP